MSDDKPKRIRRPIVINLTSPGGNDLQGCYFLASDDVEGFYNLFNELGETLATGVSDGIPFPFLHDGIAWTITDLKIHHHPVEGVKAKGNWQNNVALKANLGIIPDADGSFQAESGGGADDDVEVDNCTHPSNAIEIDTVSGGANKDKLKNCYFLPTGVSMVYDLYSKHCNLLASGLFSGNNFTFTHDKINWTVSGFVISDTAASGNWSTPDEITNAQNGSFQAESGGGMGEGEGAASAASA